MITVESIESGKDTELSRIVSNNKALVFLRTANRSFAIASCKVLDDGSIERIFGIFFLETSRLGELDHAVVEAIQGFKAAH